MPFSAHPRQEPDGTMWNFGSVPWMQKLVLYRISKTGVLEKVHVLDLAHPGMIHDFVVTERHLVFLIPPLLFQPDSQAGTFLERHVWDGSQPLRVLVIDKSDFSRQRWLEAPTSFVFHFGNAWEESNGTIHLDFCRHPNADVVFGGLRDVMWGKALESDDPLVSRMTIAPGSGGVREDIGIETGEFPNVDPRRIGRRYQHVVTLGRSGRPNPRHPQLDTLVRHDLDDGGTESWTYPETVMPEEHVVVPGPGEAPGWIVGTGLDFERRANQIAIFDEEHVADGPIATARLPYWLPMGLHGRFVPG